MALASGLSEAVLCWGRPEGERDPRDPGDRRGSARKAGLHVGPKGQTAAALTAWAADGRASGRQVKPRRANCSQLRGPGPTCVPFAPSRGLCDVSAARPRDGGLDCAPSLLTARSFFLIPNYIPIRKAPKGTRVLAWRRAELRREVSAASGAGAWSPHQRPGPRRADGGRLGRRALSHTDLCMCCSPPRSCAGKRSATSSTPRLPPAEADDASLVSGVLPLSRLDCKRCSTAASVSMVTRGDPALPLAAFPGRFPAGQSDGGGGCAVSARRATDGSGDLAAPAGS